MSKHILRLKDNYYTIGWNDYVIRQIGYTTTPAPAWMTLHFPPTYNKLAD